jgi:hypothetical protein
MQEARNTMHLPARCRSEVLLEDDRVRSMCVVVGLPDRDSPFAPAPAALLACVAGTRRTGEQRRATEALRAVGCSADGGVVRGLLGGRRDPQRAKAH